MERRRFGGRTVGTLGADKMREIRKVRKQIAKELPDLVRRNQLRFDARKEKTFSGAMRRAVHRFPLTPMKIADRAEIAWVDFSDFLTGEKPLPSDAIDRLVKVLKLKLPTNKPIPRRAKAS